MDSKVNFCRATRCRTLIAALLLIATGCSKAPTESTTTGRGDGDALAQGEQIAEKMLAAYREADRYADHATYVQHSVLRGEGVERDLPFFQMSLAFDRPNRLRLSFEEAVEGSAGRKGFEVVSNGAVMRCRAGELPDQVQESAAPTEITTENLLPDPLVREVFANRELGDVFPQLAMLLNADDTRQVFPEDESPRLLDKQSLRGRECYRVQSMSPKGKRIFWIDSENYTLHRMELPIDADRSTLDAQNQYSQLAVWIDFEDATFDAQIDDASFELTVPDDARRVRRFVAPPPPAPPEEFGKPVDEFAFETVDGDAIDAEALRGKTVLLDFWQADCVPCRAHTPELDALYRELKSDKKFAFYAVNLDGPRVSRDAAEETLRGWGGSMPVLVDPKGIAIDKLNVEATPTFMVLNGKGELQYFQVLQDRDLAGLTDAVRKVLGGANLAADARAQHRQLVKEYEAELNAMTIKDAVLDIKVARPESGERKLPEHFDVNEFWTAKPNDIARPGYVLTGASENERETRILALDGGQAIVEFDESGSKLVRHEIPGEGDQATRPETNGFLRTLIDGEGKRWFAASGVSWQKLHVFDPDWKPILTFPPDRHPGVADAQLIRYGDKGQPRLCIGYWGGVGVQGVGLDGKRKWSERSLDQVVQIVLVPHETEDASDDFDLWCTSNRGTILVLGGNGKTKREIAVGLNNIMHVAIAKIDGAISCCGLAVEAVGRYRAIGFSANGEIGWQYELPRGEYARQVERIQHVTLPDGKPAWMIAAANGTIIWIDHVGQLIDQFQYGRPLTGLSLTKSGESAILLASTPEDLKAWKLTAKKP
jgi:outer membrane lipoprotein-sorting protein